MDAATRQTLDEFDRLRSERDAATDELVAAKAEIERLRASPAMKWEADHQRAVLLHHGLADEFPFGCDAVDGVAEALLAARAAKADAVRAFRMAPPPDLRPVYDERGNLVRLLLTGEVVE